MKNNLLINIMGFKCEVTSDNQDILDKIKFDFNYFICTNLKKVDFYINIKNADAYVLPKDLKALKQTQNSITYKKDGIQINDYYGKAYTEYKNNRIEIFYNDISCLHEIIYLVILSFSGKRMDLLGRHKIHACGISMNNKNLIMMMPSKGGKTTLFLDLIMDPEVGIISDDTPVVDRKGNIHCFPLRVGTENKNDLLKRFPYIAESKLLEFERQYFTKKYLLSLKDLKNKIQVGKKTILLAGYRYSGTEPKLIKISKFKMMKELFKHQVIGVGLPMVIEYFFRLRRGDFFVNVILFLSRLWSGFLLNLKSDGYELYLSPNRMANRKLISEFMK